MTGRSSPRLTDQQNAVVIALSQGYGAEDMALGRVPGLLAVPAHVYWETVALLAARGRLEVTCRRAA